MEIIESSNDYGITQELLVESLLARYGAVSVPLGNSERYDCVLDLNRTNHFIRIQIKSLNILEDGDTIVIPMQNSNCAKKIKKPYMKEDVDYIAIAYNNEVYLFPPTTGGTLTVRINKPSYYNQHWLQDYTIDNILEIEYTSWLEQKHQTREERKENKPQYTCRICGSPVSKEGVMCVYCYRRQQQENSLRPPKEKIIEKIRNKTSFIQMGKDWGVTDNAVRKWCKHYGIPFRQKDIKQMTEEDWEQL